MMLPAWAGAGTILLLYAIMRGLALARAAALTASLMFALGTVHWKYSSVLFSHALSSFLVMLVSLLDHPDWTKTERSLVETLASWASFWVIPFLLNIQTLCLS